jgi:FkbM family methyltransferase
VHGLARRDQLRRRFPWIFAFYKRRIRRHVARHDAHYTIASWVNEGLALRGSLNIADVCIDGDGAWFIDGRGLQWRFDPEIWDSTLGAARRVSHESAEIDAVCKLLGPSSVVVDIGANVGTFALPVTQATKARVIAVEPVSSTFSLLTDNVRRNGAGDSITTVQSALGDVAGEVVMTTGAQSANYVLTGQTDPRAGEERVPVITLDGLLAEESRVDLIKVDVEGLELDVMRGARRTLAHHAPAVLLEIESRWTTRSGYRPEELFAFMADAGYGYETLAAEGPVQATSVAADLQRSNNFLFVPVGADAR